MSNHPQTLPQAAHAQPAARETATPDRAHTHQPHQGTHPVKTQDPKNDLQTLTLTIPMAAKLINLNDRLHWAAKAKLTKAWRQAGRLMARQAQLPKGLQHIEITLFVHKNHNVSFDAHNLTPTGKAIVDGLVDYGLIPDDSNAHLVGPDMRAGAKGTPRITLEIRVLRGAVEDGSGAVSAAA